MIPASIDELQARLAAERYIADRRLATSLFVALKLQRPGNEPLPGGSCCGLVEKDDFLIAWWDLLRFRP